MFSDDKKEEFYYAVTHIREGAALAAKLNRNGYQASVYKKTNVITFTAHRPWAILNGYMTNDTQVVPCTSAERARKHIDSYA